jgi:hypothetical protein
MTRVSGGPRSKPWPAQVRSRSTAEWSTRCSATSGSWEDARPHSCMSMLAPGADRRTVGGAEEQGAFPMPGHAAVGLVGPLVDHPHVDRPTRTPSVQPPMRFAASPTSSQHPGTALPTPAKEMRGGPLRSRTRSPRRRTRRRATRLGSPTSRSPRAPPTGLPVLTQPGGQHL